MSFSSRRRNYLLTPHRRDGLIEWMKSMLMHSFVLDALETTGADTFSHFEVLIDEHRKKLQMQDQIGDDAAEERTKMRPSRLQVLVPTVGRFHTSLPLRQAFEMYNHKHRLTKRKHIQISFNEIRHILNLAQVLAMRTPSEHEKNQWSTPVDLNVLAEQSMRRLDKEYMKDDDDDDDFEKDDEQSKSRVFAQLNGPRMITFDGDQTLYSDGANFESNPRLANYLTLLLRHGVTIAIVTAAGYEYNVEKYEFRISGLLEHFKAKNLTEEECSRFFLFGGECNYLLHLGNDYRLHPVEERGEKGWKDCSRSATSDSPGNWAEDDVIKLLEVANASITESLNDLNLKGRIIRKKRAVGLVPASLQILPREALDETVLRCQSAINSMNDGNGPGIPFCAFNGGRDVWVDVGNKRVGVQVLESYLGVPVTQTLHIGDQFLNTGNDYAARAVCPCIWITSPVETTYILKTILRLSGISVAQTDENTPAKASATESKGGGESPMNFSEIQRRSMAVKEMDVFTGEMKSS